MSFLRAFLRSLLLPEPQRVQYVVEERPAPRLRAQAPRPPGMPHAEKRALREYIGQYLDLSQTRLSDADALLLRDFIENYDRDWRGVWFQRSDSSRGYLGEYRLNQTWTTTFTDHMTVHRIHVQDFDDGDHREYPEETRNARSVIDAIKEAQEMARYGRLRRH